MAEKLAKSMCVQIINACCSILKNTFKTIHSYQLNKAETPLEISVYLDKSNLTILYVTSRCKCGSLHYFVTFN